MYVPGLMANCVATASVRKGVLKRENFDSSGFIIHIRCIFCIFCLNATKDEVKRIIASKEPTENSKRYI